TQSAQAWAIVWRSLDQAAPPTEDRGEKPSLCGGVLWSSDRRPRDRSKAKASIGSASGQIGQVYRLVELGGIGRRDRWHRDAARRASVGRSSAWLVRWHTPKRRSRTAIGLAKLSPRLPLLRQVLPPAVLAVRWCARRVRLGCGSRWPGAVARRHSKTLSRCYRPSPNRTFCIGRTIRASRRLVQVGRRIAPAKGRPPCTSKPPAGPTTQARSTPAALAWVPRLRL